MRISAWHKAQGDIVEWWDGMLPYERIYMSKVFTFTPDNDTVMQTDEIIKGGTGYRDYGSLPEEIEVMQPDYSIYPRYPYAVGFLTRGCIRSCPWCIVPQKEGSIRPAATWQEIKRPDSRTMILLDNNVLAHEYGLQQIEEMGYSWEQSADLIEQRTENLKHYLTDELQALNADTVRSDVPVSSAVQDVQIWSVEQTGDKVYKIVYSVSQKVVNGEKNSLVTSAYDVSVYVDDAGDLVIIQNPTITGKPQKSDYAPKAAEPDGTVSTQESTEITEFLTTFFTLYPSASEQELSYYVSGGALPVIENESYVFAALVNPIYTKQGDTVTANVAVQYLDQQTGMTQVSQFVLQLRQVDGNWKII